MLCYHTGDVIRWEIPTATSMKIVFPNPIFHLEYLANINQLFLLINKSLMATNLEPNQEPTQIDGLKADVISSSTKHLLYLYSHSNKGLLVWNSAKRQISAKIAMPTPPKRIVHTTHKNEDFILLKNGSLIITKTPNHIKSTSVPTQQRYFSSTISANDEFILTNSTEGSVSSSTLQHLDWSNTHHLLSDCTSNIACHPKMSSFAVGDKAGQISIYSLESQDPIHKITATKAPIIKLFFNSDGTFLIAVSDGALFRYDTMDYRLVATMNMPIISSLTSIDQFNLTWFLQNKKTKHPHHQFPYLTYKFNENATMLSIIEHGTITIWEIKNTVNLLLIKQQRFKDAAFHPTNNTLTSCNSTCILNWSLPSGKLKAKLGFHDHLITLIRYNATGDLLASIDEKNILKIWDTVSKELLSQIKCNGTVIISLHFNKNQNLVLVYEEQIIVLKYMILNGKPYWAVHHTSPSKPLFSELDHSKTKNKPRMFTLFDKTPVNATPLIDHKILSVDLETPTVHKPDPDQQSILQP